MLNFVLTVHKREHDRLKSLACRVTLTLTHRTQIFWEKLTEALAFSTSIEVYMKCKAFELDTYLFQSLYFKQATAPSDHKEF